jgi:hypothetical protein
VALAFRSDVNSLFDEELDEAFDSALDDDVLITATDIALRVAHRFCDRLGRETRFRTVTMPVRPEPGRAPKYVLVLFTRNVHGVWFFADTLGRAGVDWQRAIHAERQRIEAARFADRTANDSDENALFPVEQLAPAPAPPFNPDVYERACRSDWVEAIAANLHRLFLSRTTLRLVDHVDDLYGEVLGQAWEMHARAAVKQLHKARYIDDDGTGDDFWRRTIRGSRRMPEQRSSSSVDTDTGSVEAG